MTDEEAKTLGELALKADMLRRQCRDIEEKMKEQRTAMRRMAKEARDREQKYFASEKQKAANAFWKAVFHAFAAYGTAALGVLAFTLLMAVAQ